MDKTIKINLGGRDLVANLENIAEQSNGSVFLQYGDTVILSTATMNDSEEQLDFFPLIVDYRDKFYAKGKIMGSRFTRREARPSDQETCNGRLIDRSIRPLFPKELKKKIQITNTLLAFDEKNDPSVLGLIATSIALAISDIPWNGPIAAVRIGKKENSFILNPDYEERKECSLDIVFAVAEKNGKLSINMIEGSSKEVNEEAISKAFSLAKKPLKEILDFEKKIIENFGKKKIHFDEVSNLKEIEEKFRNFLKDDLEKALYIEDKVDRNNQIKELEKRLTVFTEENHAEEVVFVKNFFEKEIDRLMHRDILAGKKRFDGRELDRVRDINCRINFLPRVHGSGLFSRGKTKALSVLTLGSPGDAKLIESVEFEGEKRFMHFYNFPPYSVGDTKNMRGPGRREIGHGLLAETALLPLIPSAEEFPYTIRIVSEILSSNGSSSQASISGSSLALMDAGVPIKRHVTGIALGLISNQEGDYKILTDIQGPEDHYGDMDFKVAGTEEGITAIQMDIKIDGITEQIMEEALEKAKIARLKILQEMNKVISEPRKELSPFAPRIITLNIDPEKIGTLIGPGGKMIHEIVDTFDVVVDVEDDGQVFITSKNQENAQKALIFIQNLTREVKTGDVFEGKVKKIMTFGAFIELIPGQEGLLHISKMSDKRINKVEDVMHEGDVVSVKVILVNKREGKIDLALIKK